MYYPNNNASKTFEDLKKPSSNYSTYYSQMGTSRLRRATPVHLPNETTESPKVKTQQSPAPLATNGEDQRNHSAKREPRGRPENQWRHHQPSAEPEIVRLATEPAAAATKGLEKCDPKYRERLQLETEWVEEAIAPHRAEEADETVPWVSFT